MINRRNNLFSEGQGLLSAESVENDSDNIPMDTCLDIGMLIQPEMTYSDLPADVSRKIMQLLLDEDPRQILQLRATSKSWKAALDGLPKNDILNELISLMEEHGKKKAEAYYVDGLVEISRSKFVIRDTAFDRWSKRNCNYSLFGCSVADQSRTAVVSVVGGLVLGLIGVAWIASVGWDDISAGQKAKVISLCTSYGLAIGFVFSTIGDCMLDKFIQSVKERKAKIAGIDGEWTTIDSKVKSLAESFFSLKKTDEDTADDLILSNPSPRV